MQRLNERVRPSGGTITKNPRSILQPVAESYQPIVHSLHLQPTPRPPAQLQNSTESYPPPVIAGPSTAMTMVPSHNRIETTAVTLAANGTLGWSHPETFF